MNSTIWPKFPWRLRRRNVTSRTAHLLSGVLAVVVALLFTAVLIEVSGLSAPVLGKTALYSIFGTAYGREQAFVLATPLILSGLAVAVCYKMGLWNVGAEGQLFIGAWAAAGIGLNFHGSTPVMLVVMFLAAGVAGAIFILIPALARALWGTNEILTTLMLNFVAIYWVNYFSMGPWRDLKGATLSATPRIPYKLPQLIGTLHVGILIPIVIAVLLWLAFRGTRWGYEISIIGGNRRAAEFAGIPVFRHILTTMLLSGAIAGVAGMIEVAGTVHRLSGTISNNYGYLGIVVSALADASPLPIIPIGFLVACLLNAGIVLQTQGLSINTMYAINGVILLFVAVGEVASRYRLVRISKLTQAAPPGPEHDVFAPDITPPVPPQQHSSKT